ncbi:MAG: SGNH/GDSL hydrolase family protein [Candidatus Omnitrophica bacterium]|nr:SGNH/GDSL hydrolase family protein [Candidatus Omnitrophota bacterium]
MKNGTFKTALTASLFFFLSFIGLFYTTQFVFREISFILLICVKLVLIGLSLVSLCVFFTLVVIRNTDLSSFIKNLTLFVCASLATFLMLEAVFLFVPQSHTVGYTLAAQRWFDYYWQLENSFRYRDQEYTEDQLIGKELVFVLGDSFVAGHGIKNIKDRFSDQLAQKLPQKYAVLNLGFNGHDTRTEMYRLLTFPVKPNILIMQYFGNDIDGVANHMSRPYEGFKPYFDLPVWLKPIVKNSYFLDFIYWQFPHHDTQSYMDFAQNAYQDKNILTAHLSDLEYLIQWTKDNNIKMVFVIFPYLSNPQDSRFYTGVIGHYVRSRNIPVIDVEPLLEGLTIPQRVINKNDLHPSPEVHRRVATAIYQRLLEEHFIISNGR